MRPDSKLCFDFSLPVDKSHLEELESEKEDEKVAKYCPTKENLKDAEEYNSGAEKVVETDVAQEVVEKSDEEFREDVSTSMVVAVKVASEKVGQNEVKRDEDYGINDQSDKEEENEDEGQCEEAGDESAEDFVGNEEEPTLAGEVQGELEDKLAGEEEMASSVPFLHLQRSSCLATFAFVEPTGAAPDRGGKQVNNIN